MTDYFVLLGQPRQPWLDLEKLQESFHAKTLRAHPDAQSQAKTNFTELNEGYQVLRDPKRRLHHLLTLAGTPPSSRDSTVPEEIEGLFPDVASLTSETDIFVARLTKATSTLSRSLLRSEIATVQEKIAETLKEILKLKNAALVRLRAANESDLAELHALYLQFSYLNRWIEQLEEKRLHLTL